MHVMRNIDIEHKTNDENGFELDDNSFLPPEDNREYTSLVYDVPNGDTFHKYAEYFWYVYGHEIYDEI